MEHTVYSFDKLIWIAVACKLVLRVTGLDGILSSIMMAAPPTRCGICGWTEWYPENPRGALKVLFPSIVS